MKMVGRIRSDLILSHSVSSEKVTVGFDAFFSISWLAADLRGVIQHVHSSQQLCLNKSYFGSPFIFSTIRAPESKTTKNFWRREPWIRKNTKSHLPFQVLRLPWLWSGRSGDWLSDPNTGFPLSYLKLMRAPVEGERRRRKKGLEPSTRAVINGRRLFHPDNSKQQRLHKVWTSRERALNSSCHAPMISCRVFCSLHFYSKSGVSGHTCSWLQEAVQDSFVSVFLYGIWFSGIVAVEIDISEAQQQSEENHQ